MGCAIVTGHKSVKSKVFEHSAVEEAANLRGVGIEKVYQRFPKLLESKRHMKAVDVLTQYELSVYLDFPIKFFFHKNLLDQKRKLFMCGEGVVPCAFCGSIADFCCDFPIGEGRTCDLPLCRDHKKHRPDIGADIDYCPHHSHKHLADLPNPL